MMLLREIDAAVLRWRELQLMMKWWRSFSDVRRKRRKRTMMTQEGGVIYGASAW